MFLKFINCMVMPSSIHADSKRINSAGDEEKGCKHSFLVCRKLLSSLSEIFNMCETQCLYLLLTMITCFIEIELKNLKIKF